MKRIKTIRTINLNTLEMVWSRASQVRDQVFGVAYRAFSNNQFRGLKAMALEDLSKEWAKELWD